ncbi:UvrD-helicase domain-containing protein [Streptomyces albidoflavus]
MDIDGPRQAILDSAGHVLIEGGPGCGKTTIALLKARQALESLEDEQQVLFLSFSRAAVRQITDRMGGLLKPCLTQQTAGADIPLLLHGHRPQPQSAPDREARVVHRP